MLKRTTPAAWMAATLCLALAGCAMEMGDESAYELDPEGDIGASTEGLRVTTRVHRHTGESTRLGRASNSTCFITGIYGFLHGFDGVGIHNEHPASVGVLVDPSDGYWYAYTSPGETWDGTELTTPHVSVACVNVPYDDTLDMSWSNMGSAYPGTPVQPGRSCFINTLSSTTGLQSAGPGYRHVKITEQGNYFTFNESHVPPVGGATPPNVRATAVCFDLPTSTHWNYSWAAGTASSNDVIAHGYVRQWYDHGPILRANDYQCGLTGVGGNHLPTSPNPLGHFNQTSVSTRDYWGNQTDQWRLTATNGRWLSARCVQAYRPVRGG